MKLLLRVGVVGVALFTLASCGSTPSSNATESSLVVPGLLETNELTARTIGSGTSFSLNDALAQKPVAFWFWAPG